MAKAATVIPLLRGNHKALEEAERSQLVEYYAHYKAMSNEWLKRQIIANNRIDILMTAVLGYGIQPFHLAMLRWQFVQPDNLQLAFRGAGKSTACTVSKSIHLLLKNPNLRILIASKTSGQAEAFLREIKAHFEGNDRLAEIFGPYYDPRRVNKWDNSEIEVLPRTAIAKEGSITTIGVHAQVVGKHYDVIISDDLVDEENSRTKHMRDKTKTWYYQSLDPTLEPPDPNVPHRGEHHRQGTRYHYDDLYGHLIENELGECGAVQIIPALNERGQSPWPDKYPPAWFAKKRKASGIIIFNAQYQCDTEAMKGEVFQYDDCQTYEDGDLPEDLRIYMGVDLAISEKDSADKFAIVVIGIDGAKNHFVLDFYEGQLRFKAQTKKILEYYARWDPIRCGIETVAYQEAQYQNLKDEDQDLRIKPITTGKDKMTRAWKLSAIFEDKRMFFRKGAHNLLIEHLVLFPNYKFKDLFDALDLAVSASKMKKRKKRRSEPGLI